MSQNSPLVCWLSDLGRSDTDRVSGKNASLGEMIRALRDAGIRVPGGFATTASAYRRARISRGPGHSAVRSCYFSLNHTVPPPKIYWGLPQPGIGSGE